MSSYLENLDFKKIATGDPEAILQVDWDQIIQEKLVKRYYYYLGRAERAGRLLGGKLRSIYKEDDLKTDEDGNPEREMVPATNIILPQEFEYFLKKHNNKYLVYWFYSQGGVKHRDISKLLGIKNCTSRKRLERAREEKENKPEKFSEKHNALVEEIKNSGFDKFGDLL